MHIYIYSIHAYPAQDMTPGWEIGSASLHAPNPRGLQSVDGAHWKSCSSIAYCKAESNWVFGICKTKGVSNRFSILYGSLWVVAYPKKAPEQLVFCGPFLFGRKDAIYIAGTEGLSKKQVFQVPEPSRKVTGNSWSQEGDLKMGGPWNRRFRTCKPSFLGSMLNLESVYASQKQELRSWIWEAVSDKET